MKTVILKSITPDALRNKNVREAPVYIDLIHKPLVWVTQPSPCHPLKSMAQKFLRTGWATLDYGKVSLDSSRLTNYLQSSPKGD